MSFNFKKALGQNFLIDTNIINKIVNACEHLDTLNIIEVGPGSGNLTKALLPYCNSVTSLEIDKRLEPTLKQIKCSCSNFNYIMGDALKLEITQITKSPTAIVANLPYNIGTALYTRWLPVSNLFNYFVLMFQKEVAMRITAQVNQPHYGRLALFTNIYGTAEFLFSVSKNCFKPVPLVDSAVIKFTPHPQPLDINIEKFIQVVKVAFTSRRKTIKVSLKSYNFNFSHLQIDPTLRPENLSFEQFIKLSQAF